MHLLEAIQGEVVAAFATNPASHDFDHTMRVFHMSRIIGSSEGADMDVLLPAAMLHDIGRAAEDSSQGSLDHASLGAQMAQGLLSRLGAEASLVEAICHCISTHRFRGQKKPVSIEARVLYDADKLDCIGAIGIARAFVFAGEVGARVHDIDIDLENTKPYTRDDTAYREYLVKLRYVKDRMLTETGRRLAVRRHDFMETFFSQLNSEVSGRDVAIISDETPSHVRSTSTDKV